MTAEEVEPTWAMVAALLLHRMSSSLLSFDFAGEAHDVYFGGASNFGLISTSKLLKRFDQSRFKSRVPYETNRELPARHPGFESRSCLKTIRLRLSEMCYKILS